jgi:hypothetical protein
MRSLIDQALAGATPRQLHRVLFYLADCYNQSSEQAFASIQSNRNAYFAAPAIMCKSFAIELLLKFFIVTDYPASFSKADFDAANIDLRGHSFSNLFDRISPSGQARIASKYSERTGVTVTPASFRAALVAVGDDPFMSWRYIYESTNERHIDAQLLAQVVDSLGLAAQDATRRIGGLVAS